MKCFGFERQKQIVNYEYAIDDYYGNKHSKKEKIDGDTAVGEYKTLLPDGKQQVVTYESGPDGHKANVNYEEGGYVAPVDTYYPPAAPSYETPAPATYEPAYVEPAYEKVSDYDLILFKFEMEFKHWLVFDAGTRY